MEADHESTWAPADHQVRPFERADLHDRHRLGRLGRRAHLFGRREEARFCLPNTRFLLHQPEGGVHGPAADIAIEAREIVKIRERLSQIIATETGQSVERVRKDTERNYWMSASEAVEYGLAHKIVRSIEELK